MAHARALTPVFHRNNVANAAELVYRAAVTHAERWAGAGRVDDLYRAVQQLGAETVMEMGFGFDPADPHAVALAAALVAYKNRSMDPRPRLRIDRLHVGADTVVRIPHIAYRMRFDHARVRHALNAALASARRSGRLDWIGRLSVTQIFVLLHALHYHPDFWDDPWAIRPERWTSSQPPVPYSYVPFLLGARKCLGRDMAEQQMRLLLTAVVRRFNVTVFAEAVIPPFMIPRFAAPIPFSLAAA